MTCKAYIWQHEATIDSKIEYQRLLQEGRARRSEMVADMLAIADTDFTSRCLKAKVASFRKQGRRLGKFQSLVKVGKWTGKCFTCHIVVAVQDSVVGEDLEGGFIWVCRGCSDDDSIMLVRDEIRATRARIYVKLVVLESSTPLRDSHLKLLEALTTLMRTRTQHRNENIQSINIWTQLLIWQEAIDGQQVNTDDSCSDMQCLRLIENERALEGAIAKEHALAFPTESLIDRMLRSQTVAANWRTRQRWPTLTPTALDPERVMETWSQQGGLFAYCHEVLRWSSLYGSFDLVEIDRVMVDIAGYADNFVISCKCCNGRKGYTTDTLQHDLQLEESIDAIMRMIGDEDEVKHAYDCMIRQIQSRWGHILNTNNKKNTIHKVCLDLS
jgi:hypothetical protein